MRLLKKISNISKNHKSYRVGLLQTKAYRVLKHQTNKLLEPYGISSVEWALLGLLYENSKDMRSMAIADELGVEAPFVTNMHTKLYKMGLIQQTTDPKDNRAKLVSLTPKGKMFTDETELYLRREMKPLFKDVSVQDLLTYLDVLQTVIDTSADKKSQ